MLHLFGFSSVSSHVALPCTGLWTWLGEPRHGLSGLENGGKSLRRSSAWPLQRLGVLFTIFRDAEAF